MTVAIEEERLRGLFERVEAIEDVARTLPEHDARRAKLLAVSDSILAEEVVRPVIAARLLGLSEKTVRAWAAAGALTIARRSPRLVLDLRSVHKAGCLVRELRTAGHNRDLLEQVRHRLASSP